MKMNFQSKPFLAAIVITTLCACSAQRVAESQTANQKVADESSARLGGMIQTNTNRPNFVVRSGSPWVQTKAIKTSEAQVAEQHPEIKCDIVYVTQTPATLLEFAQRTSTLCGIPVRVTGDVMQMFGNSIGASGSTTGSLPSLPAIPDLPVPTSNGLSSPTLKLGGGNASVLSASSGMPRSIMTKYRGPVAGLLDSVTASLGLAWRASADGVEIYWLDTQYFSLMALQSTTETSSVIQAAATSSQGGGSSSMSGTSGSNQSTTTSIKNDLLADLEKNLKTMITPTVGRMSISPSTGTVAVTDTPNVLRSIRAYLDRENKKMTQQVAFRVEIYSVTTKDNNEDSIDMDLVYTRLGKQGFTLKNLSGLSADHSVQGGIAISGDSPWSGSKMLFNALAEQGSVKVVTKSTVYTTNLQPAPVQVSRQTAYLQSSTMNNSGSSDGSVTTSLQPGTITTGFSMSLLPYILPESDGEILLQYVVNLSNLVALKTVESGGSSMQTPEIDSRIFSQRVKVRDGEMLVVGGFEQETDDATAQGTGSAYNPLLGGGFSSKKARSVIVVAITPSMGGQS